MNRTADIQDIAKKVYPEYPNENKSVGFKGERDSLAHIKRKAFRKGLDFYKKTYPFTKNDMTEFLHYYNSTARISFDSTMENEGKSYDEILEAFIKSKS